MKFTLSLVITELLFIFLIMVNTYVIVTGGGSMSTFKALGSAIKFFKERNDENLQ